MGMFDTVTFEDVGQLPLPDKLKGFVLPNDFQTKDLECLMDEYVISNNSLHKKIYKYEDLTDSEYQEYLKSIEQFKSSSLYDFWKDSGKKKRVFDHLETVREMHGYVRVYDYVKDDDSEYYIEYNLKFTDGILVDIKLAEFREYGKSKDQS